MKEIRVLSFNLRHVIHTPSFRMVNLLCCGGHFSYITFIDVNSKFIDVKSLSLGRFLALLIEPYEDALNMTSLREPLRTSVGHVSWS